MAHLIDDSKNFKNLILNGECRIAQRGLSFPNVADSAYTLDRFIYTKIGTMVHTVSQDTDVPTFAQSGYFFQNSLKLTCTTAQAVVGSGDFCAIEQRIEGYNFVNVAQKTLTVFFWIKAAKAGSYTLSLRNGGADRSHLSEIVVSNSNSWEFKSLKIAPSTTSGSWNYSSGIGLRLGIVLAAGTGFRSTTVNSWQSLGFLASTNQVNAVDSTSNTVWLTGISLIEGGAAQSFKSPTSGFAAELAACQRYYYQIPNIRVAGWIRDSDDGYDTNQVSVPVEMRASPTATHPGTSFFNIHVPNELSISPTTMSINVFSPSSISFSGTAINALTGATRVMLFSGGPVFLSAEL